MRRLRQTKAPAILLEKEETWRDEFLKKRAADKRARPPARRYRHPTIVDELTAMSHKKCFYCEQFLLECDMEVDHYIEVALSPELAFSWENLYLSCKDCNRKKLTHDKLSCNECIDPRGTEDPADLLTFDDEMIRPRDQSDKGRNTIRKHALNRDDLDHRRVKHLHRFEKVLNQILRNMNRENRQKMNHAELEVLLRFVDPTHPFSLMFQAYLTRAGFLH